MCIRDRLRVALITFILLAAILDSVSSSSRLRKTKNTNKDSGCLEPVKYTLTSNEKYHLTRYALRHYKLHFDHALNPESVRINSILSTQIVKENTDRVRVQISVDIAEPTGTHTGIFRFDVSGTWPIVTRQGGCNSCYINGISFFPVL
eukprot:TRINITY_DN5471_c0_g1_i14.p1 TRINITY_DN5471_c0_g1~~TRINITY_DN5471_c0_g1_i14.p1  ORF type:complete len:148 (-),score=8.68 TRINITY_DN5471_c0_g1_i14:68-511(-)